MQPTYYSNVMPSMNQMLMDMFINEAVSNQIRYNFDDEYFENFFHDVCDPRSITQRVNAQNNKVLRTITSYKESYDEKPLGPCTESRTGKRKRVTGNWSEKRLLANKVCDRTTFYVLRTQPNNPLASISRTTFVHMPKKIINGKGLGAQATQPTTTKSSSMTVIVPNILNDDGMENANVFTVDPQNHREQYEAMIRTQSRLATNTHKLIGDKATFKPNAILIEGRAENVVNRYQSSNFKEKHVHYDNNACNEILCYSSKNNAEEIVKRCQSIAKYGDNNSSYSHAQHIVTLIRNDENRKQLVINVFRLLDNMPRTELNQKAYDNFLNITRTMGYTQPEGVTDLYDGDTSTEEEEEEEEEEEVPQPPPPQAQPRRRRDVEE